MISEGDDIVTYRGSPSFVDLDFDMNISSIRNDGSKIGLEAIITQIIN